MCDENEPGKITEVKKEGTCATTFSLASQCGARPRCAASPTRICSRARAAPRHACPATGGSTLSTILIIALVAFAVYLVGGFLYNMKFKELRGIEAIPNIEFWRDFPALVVVRPSSPPEGAAQPRRHPRLPSTRAQDGVKFTVHQLQDLRARFGGGSDAGAETF